MKTVFLTISFLMLLAAPPSNAAFARDGEVLYLWNDFLRDFARPGLFLPEFREAALIFRAGYQAVKCALGHAKKGACACSNLENVSPYNAANSAMKTMWKLQLSTRPSAFSAALYWNTGGNAGQLPTFLAAADAQYTAIRSLIQTETGATNQQLNRGERLGENVANDLWEQRKTDGFDVVSTFSVPCAAPPCPAGQWWAPFAGIPRPPYAQWANLTLFCDDPADGGANNHKRFRVPPPPQPWTQQSNNTADITTLLGQDVVVTPLARTANMELSVNFWQETSGYHYFVPVVKMIDDNTPLSLESAARVLALVSTAALDSNIMQYDNKLRLTFWRPWQQNNFGTSALDQNGVAPGGWKPYLMTPPHPDYPAGHPMTTGTWTRMFERLFPNIEKNGFPSLLTYNVTSVANPSTRFVISYRSFSEMNHDVVYARIWGGIHYPVACMEGQRIGRIIGDFCFRKLKDI